MARPTQILVSALMAGFVLGAAACGPSRLSLDPPAERPSARDYPRIRDAWTRRHERYHNVMEGRLFVTATYFSKAFRRAWLAAAEEAFGWDGAARAAEEQRVHEEDDHFHTFFIAVATYEWRWNRLHVDDSPWRLWLEDDSGRKAQPVEVERVRVERAVYASFFPYLDPFSEGYLVRFRRVSPDSPLLEGERPHPRLEGGTREFILRVTGPPATAELKWRLN